MGVRLGEGKSGRGGGGGGGGWSYWFFLNGKESEKLIVIKISWFRVLVLL